MKNTIVLATQSTYVPQFVAVLDRTALESMIAGRWPGVRLVEHVWDDGQLHVAMAADWADGPIYWASETDEIRVTSLEDEAAWQRYEPSLTASKLIH